MSEKFLIDRKIEIDAAHRVPDHKSKCFALHGHRYVIHAGCEGDLQPAGEQNGMVMDFGFLKELMMDEIHEPCDHGTILHYRDNDALNTLGVGNIHALPYLYVDRWKKIYLIDCVPTAENLARHWFERLDKAIKVFFQDRKDGYDIKGEIIPQLAYVKVYETPNCWAEYRPPVITADLLEKASQQIRSALNIPSAHFPPFDDVKKPGGTD